MPLISQFYGILIYIYKELGGHHKEPHFHVKYNEYEMSISLSGKVLDGYIPTKQKKLLDAWLSLHEDELKASWYSYNNDGEVIKIKGLEWFYET
mgnify:FL=1